MSAIKIKWSPKIHPQKLVTLYQRFMANQADETEVDDVGLWLYLRVRDILLIADHKLICPHCGEVFEVPPDSAEDPVKAPAACPNPACSFSISWQAYHLSWRHKELFCGNALPCFQQYFDRYPLARGINEKMIAIDTLIHGFHVDLRVNLPNRAAANNLIEGSLRQVVGILDKLSGVQPENDDVFRETVEKMWDRRRGV